MVNHPIPSEVASRLRKNKAKASAIGGSLISPFTMVLGLLIVIAMYFLAQRFIYGLGAVTNINNGYPWGIWVVWDVVIATGFACGGYAMALVTYILNRGEYHHLVRPALTASLFGYSLGGLSVLIDLGRYWNFWHILSPSYAQTGSVMFEVAACISCYILVLWIEFSPAFLEHLGMKSAKKALNKFMFVFIGLGVLLPTMHQSSLGSLLVVFGYQIHPLWQTPLLPLLFLLTAVCMGFAIVILEATLAAVGFKRDIAEDLPMLSKIGKIIMGILAAYVVIRLGDLMVRGGIGKAFTSGIKSVMFLIEMAAFIYPIVVLSKPSNRRLLSKLLAASMSMLTGAVLYRIDAFLVAYDTGPGWHYFPSAPEMLVTIGVIAIEVLAYIIFVRKFPILPGHSTTAAAE
ncbi:Ni/Fe-hydrogenase cytochrome b subunit [Paramagnetospirillum kuznetsovii]|uniref:Ni/Fe-hydrogenase cytochrome b subunit n=1 Tax=Paramagnetospirillum kuznetsovii TaxID=2053833 RepID=A0A364NUU5_9PROT|nr:Ni/Fe-hydrogenase cytochrome b subunit [Paramagnetospirillum kuznetsovii]RAU20667.1 Ni/Fe-hydrogenase cytochrome b subunit [Paramagnetospirillum kuznetsovii]